MSDLNVGMLLEQLERDKEELQDLRERLADCEAALRDIRETVRVILDNENDNPG